MSTVDKSNAIIYPRDIFLGTAASTLAATHLATIRSASAQSVSANALFAALKQIDAGTLSVGYAEAGPAGGPAVLLLHGWPSDIYSFVEVAPILASAGYRVIVPFTRGYGPTRFLSTTTPATANR